MTMFSAKQNKKTGNIGEEIACIFIKNKGFLILGRNINEPGVGEIDILARDPSGELVFVEVKTIRRNSSGYLPEDNLTREKLRKLHRVYALFSAKHRNLFLGNPNWRSDGITITIDAAETDNSLTDIYKNCIIKHYKNI